MSKQLSRAELEDIIQTAQKRVDDPETVEPYKSVFVESLKKAKEQLAALDLKETQGQNSMRHSPAGSPQPKPAITLNLHDTPVLNQTVVVDASSPEHISLKIQGNYQNALIVIEMPDGQKKNYLPGQAAASLRSLIRDRIVPLKKPMEHSKCFKLAVALYGGLCVYFKKSITHAALFAKRVGAKIKKAFSQVKDAWENQQKSATQGR